MCEPASRVGSHLRSAPNLTVVVTSGTGGTGYLGVQLAKAIQAGAPDKKLVTFAKLLEGDAKVAALREKVKAYASTFGMPGKPFGKYNPEPKN